MSAYPNRTGAPRGARRPPLLSLALLLVSPAIGCGDDQPATVVIESSNPPALVAFREDTDPHWQAIPAERDGTFQVHPAGPYRVVIACQDHEWNPAPVRITEYARTPEDGPSIEHECFRDASDFHVRGRVAQPGAAHLGRTYREGYEPQWSFDFPLDAGTFDLFIRVGAQLAIRRDLALTRYTDLGLIDLTLEDTVALIPVTFTVSNLQPSELTRASSHVDTGSTTASLQQPMSADAGWTTMLAPESALRETDRQIATFLAFRPNVDPNHQDYHRSVARDVRISGPTSAALPEPLGPVTFEHAGDRLTAAVSTLPEHDEVTLRWTSSSMGVIKDHRLALSQTFLDATTASSITLELAGIPGFKDAWRHAPEVEQSYSLTASRRLPGERASSQVYERAPPTWAWRR